MRFARAFGGKGDAPGQFAAPEGVALVRGLLVVSDSMGKRVQVLTSKGVPLQVLNFNSRWDLLGGVCTSSNEDTVWVADFGSEVVRVLKLKA